ncbi:MAG: hypothetical protein EXS08_05905 [Planctomycetes bacterium]|nr:hypothetical protein [Planctomycetota bacterium]
MTTRISVGSGGVQGTADSYSPALSANGRFVAFQSDAPNLVPHDTNGEGDVFVRDRLYGITTLVSLNSSGLQGNGESEYPTLSADGRLVAFWSRASNLVPGDTNGVADVFVRDLLLGTTVRASVDSAGVQADRDSINQVLSGDGRFVAFESIATNLIPGDTNNQSDIFVRDLLLGTTVRASVDSAGAQGNRGSHAVTLSDDGSKACFETSALLSGADANGFLDVYVRDLLAGTTVLATVASNGVQGNQGGGDYPAISGDGRTVAFSSLSTNLVPGDTNEASDVFVHDLVSGVTARVSVDSHGAQGDQTSWRSFLSTDGRYVAFKGYATNLAPRNDTNGVQDVFWHDRVSGITLRMSEASDGTLGNAASSQPMLSADGRTVAFYSVASNLVPGDTNGVWDVFVRDIGKLRAR